MQKLTDDSCKKLDDLLAKKEKELMAVVTAAWASGGGRARLPAGGVARFEGGWHPFGGVGQPVGREFPWDAGLQSTAGRWWEKAG